MKLKALILAVLISVGWVNIAFADVAYKAYKSGSYSEALRLWKSQAEDGDAMSQYNVGLMYANGHGTLKDDKKSIYWLEKSAYGGYAKAQKVMATHYINQIAGWTNMYSEKARFWVEALYNNKDDTYKEEAKELWEEYELSKYTAPSYMENRMKSRIENNKSLLDKAKSWFD